MAKKDNIIEEGIELTEQPAEVKPAAPVPAATSPVLPGYIRIRLKDGSGKPAGIIVHATQYGVDKAYKPETWELIEDTKKK
jgi:hypothetical protein